MNKCESKEVNQSTSPVFSNLLLAERPFYKLIMVIIVSSALFPMSGCASLGPSSLKRERINYNVALQQTNDEQLLLNLVRLKYRDTPIFLEVSGLSTQFAFDTSVEAKAEVEIEEPTRLFGFGGRAAYAEQPTVTYTPLQGEEFIQRFLSPITLDTMMLLYRSGWSLKRVFSLCVQRLNDVKNAPRASGPTPGHVPEYMEFKRTLKLMSELQKRDALDFVYETYEAVEGRPRVVMQIAQEALEYPETLELTNILRLEPGKTHYPLTYLLSRHMEEPDPNILQVETRSLLGIMFYLSQSVEVPEMDQQRGKVTITRDEKGDSFDWRNVTGDVLVIQSESLKPDQAAVAISYRGSWPAPTVSWIWFSLPPMERQS